MALVFLFFTIGVGIFFVTRTFGDLAAFFSAFYQQFDDKMHLSTTGPILDLPPYTPVLEVLLSTNSCTTFCFMLSLFFDPSRRIRTWK